MKKTPHALTRLFTLLLASLTILSISVAAAGTAGSSSDPLVTLSYLNEKFLPELMTRVDEKLAARTDTASKELRAQVDADIKRLEEKYGSQTSNEGASVGTVDSFAVVTMTNGQVLYGAIGCEVMLRVGTASVVSPSSPGLIDSTGGTTLDNGAGLTKNHLYMMTISDRGVKVKMYDTSVTPASYIVSDAFKYSHLVFAATTYNAGMFVTMEQLLHDIAAHNLQKRKVALIENGSWACKSGDLMQAFIDEELKNMTVLNERLSLASSLQADKAAELDQLADALVESLQEDLEN